MKHIFRALAYLRAYKATATGAFLSLLLVNAANLATPQVLRLLIDRGITGLNLNWIWYTTGALLVIAFVRGLFNFLQGYWSEVVSQGVAFDLRNIIFEKLQNLSFSYHDHAQTGKLMTRMTSDVELVRIFIGQGFIQMLGAIIMMIGTIAALFIMNWLLALVVLGVIPGIGVIFFFLVKNVMPVSRQVQQKLAKLNTILQENLAGIRVVKAFAREEFEFERYQEQNFDLLGSNLQLLHLFTKFFPVIFFIANLGVLFVVWVGGIQVIGENISLGDLVAFISYQGFLLMPVFIIGMVSSILSRAEASAARVFEVVDASSEVTDKPDALELPPLKGKVSFEKVSFRYIGSEDNVISDISFTAEPGDNIAILGQTGSGKSTIINLIPRFYDVTEGRVCIDEIDVRDVTLSSLRSQIGIVLQETTLFSGSIRENIAYGRPDASMDQVIMAAKAAQAHDFIAELPDRYDTLVGERGIGLSGGQKQRIAIARALLVDPRILILDDSTSSVDAETEYKIQKALNVLMEGRTSFIIAQRISTVRDADLILLLDDGQLAARGTHAELLQTSELYVEIIDTQIMKKDNRHQQRVGQVPL